MKCLSWILCLPLLGGRNPKVVHSNQWIKALETGACCQQKLQLECYIDLAVNYTKKHYNLNF